MKRLFIIALTSLIAISSFAQEHLKVKGVPIDGNVDSFIKALEATGLKKDAVLSQAVDSPILIGDFAGLSDCKFSFLNTEDGTVCKVLIISEDFTGWSSTKSKYRDLKDLLKTKYEVTNSFEYFSSPYYEGDGYELSAIRQDKGTYKTFFKCDEGYIVIEINASSTSKGYLTIMYEDTINMERFSQERDKKMADDI
ncbi:MAG: hypothetical protein J6S85_03345 [Methanobrevibacter sp.]|nr:hypothetical protein [Methanobrevibacter sp.]